MLGDECGANSVDGKIFRHPICVDFPNRAFGAMLCAGEEARRNDAKLRWACLCRAGDATGNASFIGQVKIPGLSRKAKDGPFPLRFRSVG
jgi:hypothetical protein